MGILCPATNGGTSPHTPPLRIRKSDEIEDKKPGQGQPLWTRRSHPPSGDIKAIQYPIDATATRLTTAIPTVTRYYAIQELRRSPVSPRPTTTRPTVTRTSPPMRCQRASRIVSRRTSIARSTKTAEMVVTACKIHEDDQIEISSRCNVPQFVSFITCAY